MRTIQKIHSRFIVIVNDLKTQGVIVQLALVANRTSTVVTFLLTLVASILCYLMLASMLSLTDLICSGGGGTAVGSGDDVTGDGSDGEGDLDLLRDEGGKSDGGNDNDGISDGSSE
ncbi:hypothetical protein Tco_1353484 [Tanacetum coccineum]